MAHLYPNLPARFRHRQDIYIPPMPAYLRSPPMPSHHYNHTHSSSTPSASHANRQLTSLITSYLAHSATLTTLLRENNSLGGRRDPSQLPPGLQSTTEALQSALRRVRQREEEIREENRALRARRGRERGSRNPGGDNWNREAVYGSNRAGVENWRRGVHGLGGARRPLGRRGEWMFEDESEFTDDDEWDGEDY